jgi:hypothetical protein
MPVRLVPSTTSGSRPKYRTALEHPEDDVRVADVDG